MNHSISLVLSNLFVLFMFLAAVILYKLIFKKNINYLILLILLSFIPILSIFRSGTYESGDLTIHTVFLQSFFENISDGIFIPGWAGGLCAGYGCPVFQFLYPLPYYIGSFFHILGFSFLNSTKILLAFSFIASGVSMYVFLKSEFESRIAFVGSLLYLLTPIHLIELHFLASIGSTLVFVFIPLVFLFAKKSANGDSRYIVLGAINFVLLIMSHSSATIIIIPISIIYIFLLNRELKGIIYVLISYALGFGLSAYYTIPAILEIKYTWYIESMKNITDFKPFTEYLFSTSRFGLLFQGNDGQLKLNLGYSNLLVVFIAFIFMIRKQFKKNEMGIVFFLLIFVLICFILLQSISKPIWDNVFFIRTFQFPYRLMTPVAFVTAYLCAIVIKSWPGKLLVIFSGFIILTTILNWGNRKMVPFDEFAYKKHWSLYTEYIEPKNSLYGNTIYKRMDKVPNLVLDQRKKELEIINGEGNFLRIKRTQTSREYVLSAKNNIILLENTFYFPGWKTYVDGNEVEINKTDNDNFGKIIFKSNSGLHLINVNYEDTAIRKAAKMITLVTSTLTILILLLIFNKNLRTKRIMKMKNRKKIHENYHITTSEQYKIIKTNNFTYRHLIEMIEKHLKPGMKILDIGCGAGTLDFYFAKKGYEIMGIDISRIAIKSCLKTKKNLKLSNVNFILADFPKKITKNKFDFIIFTEVIEHLPDDKKAIKEIYKMLNKNGILFLSTPLESAPLNKMGLTKNFDISVGHLRRYKKEDLKNLIENEKFKILEITENEGIIRNFLFVNKYAGKTIKIINKFLSNPTTWLDKKTQKLFGTSNIFIIANKTGN